MIKNKEYVLICHPETKKIESSYIISNETPPISGKLLKLQYNNLLNILENENIETIKIKPSTMDSVFTQDPFIITPTHVVVGKFCNQLRLEETESIQKFARNLAKHKNISLYNVKTGFLEGGDYLLYKNISFIMTGQRTSKMAVKNMMKDDVFGTQKIARITPDKFASDPTKIHLDLILGFIDNTAVLWRGAKSFIVDVFERTGKKIASIPLDEYLKSLGFRIFEITDYEQKTFTCNFLCFRNFVLTQNPRLSEATQRKVIVANVSELNKMGGGLHCSVKQL